MHIVIVGGGSALAGPLIGHYLSRETGNTITAVCRDILPSLTASDLTVIKGIDMATEKARVLLEVPPIDILITLVGSCSNARIENMTLSQWDQVIEDNLTTVFQTMKYAGPRMAFGGSLVVVGSIMGSLGGFGCANYSASKAGLQGLVKTCSNEWLQKGVRANLLELGYTSVGMGTKLGKIEDKVRQSIPLKRFATTQEVVHAIDFLASNTYLTGTTLTLAGGLI